MDSIHKAVGVASGDTPTPQQQLMIQTLVMMQMKTTDDDNKPAPKTDPPPPQEREKKVKSTTGKHFSEALLLGKKLGGMVRHAESIKKQSGVKDNLWS